jgi:plasmid stability protein
LTSQEKGTIMEPIDSPIRERTPMNYTLKNIPDAIYEKIKLRAQRHRRSINSEIINILYSATTSRRPSVEEILARADELRARTKGFITDEFINAAKREGRP